MYRLPRWLRQWRICLQCRRPRFDPWVGKFSCKREWLLNPVFLPREFHGQKILGDYSPWGCKELDTTEWLTLSYKTYHIHNIHVTHTYNIYIKTYYIYIINYIISFNPYSSPSEKTGAWKADFFPQECIPRSSDTEPAALCDMLEK